MPDQMSTPSVKKDFSKLYVPAAILLAGALIGGGIFFGLSRTGGAGAGAPAAQKVDIKDVKTDGDPFIGKADAPVTIAYWSDYQCPFCKAVEVGGIPQIPITPAIPQIIKEYVDTGKVKLVFKDYPFLGNDSVTGALYEHAVWHLYPETFYEWREAMFKAQDDEGDVGFGNEESILKLIKTIPGLDAAKLKADVAANKDAYQKAVEADRAEGTALGIQGTPGFITGTTLIPGAVEFGTFKQAVDAQLK